MVSSKLLCSFFFIFRLDDDDEETPDASSIHFRFVGGVLLEMIEGAFHSLERKKKNLARRVRFQQRYICCNCDEFPSSREGGVLFHSLAFPRNDDDERR